MSEMCEQSASTLHETSDDKTTATEPNGNSTKSERAALKMDSEWEEYHGKLLRMVKKEVGVDLIGLEKLVVLKLI